MTRKHFQAIAQELAAAVELNKGNPDALKAVERAIEGLCSVFSRENPRFNKGRFLKACGVEE